MFFSITFIMSNLIISELENAEIRVTEDERYSVFDFIQVVGNYKVSGVRKAWSRIIERYPEICDQITQYSFGGRGGAAKKTPVIDKQGLLYILGVLPGALGHKYRQEAAKLVCRYLDADITLAEEVVDRNNNPADLERLAKRAEGKVTRLKNTDILNRFGVSGKGIAICSGNTYKGLFGKIASTLKKEKGIKPKQNLRDAMSTSELTIVGFTELAQCKKMIKEYVQDGQKPKPEEKEYYKICYDTAKKVKQFMDNI